MNLGDFVAVLSYTMNLFQPLNHLARVYSQIMTATIDLQNLSELLATEPDIKDIRGAQDLPSGNDADFAIEFDNVQFNYPSQPKSSGLKGLSFKVKTGTKTAIVGATGAGKTTVGRLLLRFYDVLGGTITVNGKDIRTVTQSSLRKTIGCVPQVPTLFNESLKYNIKYGKQGASDEDVVKACKDAMLWNFIGTLPKGWDSVVGDRGLKLSGGEKQRAAIARCILNQPPIVLLDEATSALDTVTEHGVKEALDRMGSGRTSVVIAHRLGTICDADSIIVLDNGIVLEQGTHDELLRLNGKYAEMWNLQHYLSPEKPLDHGDDSDADLVGPQARRKKRLALSEGITGETGSKLFTESSFPPSPSLSLNK